MPVQTASADLSAHKGVLVLAETRDGALLPDSFALVSEAKRLADALGTTVTAIAVGCGSEKSARDLGGYGADEVILLDDPLLRTYTTEAYAKVVAEVALSRLPEAFLIAATHTGRDLAPRLAARLDTGLCADCMRIDADQASYESYLRETSALSDSEIRALDSFTVLGTRCDVTHDLKMTLPAFGGNLMATIVCPRFRPAMATVRTGLLETTPFSEERAAETVITRFPVSLSASDVRTEILETVRETKTTADLAEADVVIAVGRGIAKDPARGVALAEELAAVFGGLVGGTRVAIEKGWLSPDRQIGQSGRTVRPKLLIALGISGAAQFTIGVPKADCIVAVNKDKNAPIFSFADYGITGDVFRVVPELIRAFRTAKERNG